VSYKADETDKRDETRGRKMKTYTYGTTPRQIIKEALPHKYPMELNRSDMLELLSVLRSNSSDWSMSMRMSILETIGIEEL